MSDTLDLGAMFSGASILERTNENKLREMKSGLAKIASVEYYLSKSGNNCVKIGFDALSPKDNGHDEFLRTGKAEHIRKGLGKLAYMFKIADIKPASALFDALQVPVTAVLGADNLPIKFETNAEFEEIKAEKGEDMDWIWKDSDSSSKDKTRIAVMLGDTKPYCDAFVLAVQALGDAQYTLNVKIDDKGFQRLDSIKSA